MHIDEPGKGRRVRCPICNAMFTIEGKDDYMIHQDDSWYATLRCPDCDTPLRISLEVAPKQDVFVAGRV